LGHYTTALEHYEGWRVDRPVRELKAFQRITLARGETKTASLAFPASDLAYWEVTANSFVIEPIDYGVQCGSSSRELPLQARFSLPISKPRDPPKRHNRRDRHLDFTIAASYSEQRVSW